MLSNRKRRTTVIAVVLAAMATTSMAAGGYHFLDFGRSVERGLAGSSRWLFGFGRPLAASATEDDVVPREAASAAERQFLAHGLKARFVTRAVGGLGDMIAFWPNDVWYSHVIVCNEWGRGGTTPGGADGQNPSVQRVNVQTGQVETILYGMDRCDGIRTTQWGTVLATEETDDGAAYEILQPLATTGHWIADRGVPGAPADIRDGVDSPSPSMTIVKRPALVTQAWEGLEVLDNGVVIGGDELRQERDADGGAIFRFVPETLHQCVGAPVRPGQLCGNTISDLDQSPLVAGRNYALFSVCSGTDDYGQGCETSPRARWVEVEAATARADAFANGATGYCRPEDLHVDRSYGLFAGEEGIRWCWNNTCGGGFGETLCAVEGSASVAAHDEVSLDIGGEAGFKQFLSAGSSPATALVTRFVEGDPELNSHDNLDIQPFSHNVYVIEDTGFGDIWACLQDGEDRDLASDGCVRMLSIRDPDAEPSGFIFDGTGRRAFYHVQHGQQPATLLDYVSNPMNGETDDLVMITGFERVHTGCGHRHHW